MAKIDLIELARQIDRLEYHQKLYAVLRDGLRAQGYWRVKSRGDPSKGFKASHKTTPYS